MAEACYVTNSQDGITLTAYRGNGVALLAFDLEQEHPWGSTTGVGLLLTSYLARYLARPGGDHYSAGTELRALRHHGAAG
jgi:hypothetical protein